MLRKLSCLALLLLMAIGAEKSANAAGVVINEIWNGSGVDEWIELYNNSGSSVDVSGWTLARRTNAATSDATMATFPGALNSSTTVIPAGGYYALGDSQTTFTMNQTYTNAISTGLQSIALMNGSTQMDGLGVGTGTPGVGTLAHTEGSIYAANISSNTGVSRYPDGTDTNNNSVDFVPTTGAQRTFKAANVPVELSDFSAD